MRPVTVCLVVGLLVRVHDRYWGFWLIQHMPNEDGSQLTLSYTGSRLWHILNFGELYHVEHHDFPRIPWTRLHRCQVSSLASQQAQWCVHVFR